jgi:hypothetical protein
VVFEVLYHEICGLENMSSRMNAKIWFCFEVTVISNMKWGSAGYVEFEIEIFLFIVVK